jgi:hypothetical protein
MVLVSRSGPITTRVRCFIRARTHAWERRSSLLCRDRGSEPFGCLAWLHLSRAPGRAPLAEPCPERDVCPKAYTSGER